MNAVSSPQPATGLDLGSLTQETEIPTPFGTTARKWSPFEARRSGAGHAVDDDGCRYLIHGQLNTGGMSVVYSAWDTVLGREVALKVQREEDVGHPARTGRFAREAWLTAQLQHKNILPAHDAGRLRDGRAYLTLPLVHGVNMRVALSDRPSPRVELGRWLRMFSGVCRAIKYAHSRGVVHRDLKPSNVLIAEDDQPLVIDWGLAQAIPSDRR